MKLRLKSWGKMLLLQLGLDVFLIPRISVFRGGIDNLRQFTLTMGSSSLKTPMAVSLSPIPSKRKVPSPLPKVVS